MRLGENALFLLPGAGVIVRIARGPEAAVDAAKELAVARWLRDLAARRGTAGGRDGGLCAADHGGGVHPVTFWKRVPNSGVLASTSELGGILRQLHTLPVPARLELPAFDIFRRVDDRLDRARGVAPTPSRS